MLLLRTSFHNFGPQTKTENLFQFMKYFLSRNYSSKTFLGVYIVVFYDVVKDIWNLIVVKFIHKV